MLDAIPPTWVLIVMQILLQSLVRSIAPKSQNIGANCQSFAKAFQVLLLALALGLIAKPSQAFDTGHHADVTRDVMLNQGLGNTAIEITQLENWLVDYYSVSPTSSIKGDVSKLHFDNLFTTRNVGNYWGHLTVNTRNAVQAATREKDPLKLLTVMGISLHAVQDFYSHSNWVETHPTTPRAYRTETWFNNGFNQGIPVNFYTGYASSYQGPRPANAQSHGGYEDGLTKGLNKDAYARPNWDQAYVFAYVASREWISSIRRWINEVDPTFWESVRSFNVVSADRTKLDNDLEAMYRVSEWVKDGSDDGHWKGKGSGSRADFLGFTAAWLAKPAGRFVAEFRDRKTYLLLSNGLTGDTPVTTTIPNISKLNPNQRAIVLKTVSAAEKGDLGTVEPRIDPGGEADFYAKITIAGQTFTEAMQLDKALINPPWTTIKFVPNTVAQIPITYQLWDEDQGPFRFQTEDDIIDINPIGGVRDLNFSFGVTSHNLAGDLFGVHDSVANQVNTRGADVSRLFEPYRDTDRGILEFYVTERSLTPVSEEPVLQGLP
jgi:hypothetical protein